MKRDISILQLSQAAWADFSKAWISWVLLAAGGIVLMLVSIGAHFYLPEYKHIAMLLLTIPGAVYTAMLHQNGLDAAYGRKLSLLNITPSILFASLFFIAISLYNPFPEYSEFLMTVLPADFKFLIAINWMIHLFVSYVLVRCMFVGMILLEEKCNVIDAFKKSFKLTGHHLFFLLGLFMSLALVLAISALTIVGYFIALPYTVLVKSLVFKYLNENVK